MLRSIGNVFAKVGLYGHRRNVRQALALHHRGEVRQDGLGLVSMCNTLEIEWRARDVHPWDRDGSSEEKRKRYVAQTLADTEAAISRLFERLPHIDVLQIRILGLESNTPILGGTVYRSSLSEAPVGLAVGMRLRQLGITYHSGGVQFEPLTDPGAPHNLAARGYTG
jgi:hypothetical protein